MSTSGTLITLYYNPRSQPRRFKVSGTSLSDDEPKRIPLGVLQDLLLPPIRFGRGHAQRVLFLVFAPSKVDGRFPTWRFPDFAGRTEGVLLRLVFRVRVGDFGWRNRAGYNMVSRGMERRVQLQDESSLIARNSWVGIERRRNIPSTKSLTAVSVALLENSPKEAYSAGRR
jgi:hypothetical protein